MRETSTVFSGLAALALLLPGCASNFSDYLSSDAADPSRTPGAQTGEVAPPTRSAGRLQQQVMDFSDRFSNDIRHAVAAYIAAEPDVAKQVRAQRLRLGLDTTAMTIAASLDPRANLLDMAVFISAGKWAAGSYWVPDWLGEKAAGLRAAYDSADREIWEQVDAVLTPGQSADLRALIEEWKKTADPRDVVNARLRNLDGVVLSRFQESASAKGLLANVRRLLGKVDQSLLYGERMMFYIERTPLVLAQQADLTVDRVAERFPIATVNPNFDEWRNLASGLPLQIGAFFEEREELVRDVLPEVRASLESFERITQSLQGTVAAADSLAAKARELPFEPQDYAMALDRTTESLDKLNALVSGLNELLDGGEPRAAQLARLLDERTDRAMDALFQRAAALIGIFIVGLLLVMIVARILFRRQAGAQPSAIGQPK